MSREVLAVDIDDTLFPFTPEFLRYYNGLHGTNFCEEDMITYDYCELLGVEDDKIAEDINRFHQQDDLHIQPITYSREVIARLHEDSSMDFIGVTMRHPELQVSSLRYLQNAYEGAFTGVFALGYDSRITKADVCREAGALALVDDSMRHLRTCVAGNIGAVLFAANPWSRYQESEDGIVMCKDWLEVEGYIRERSL